ELDDGAAAGSSAEAAALLPPAAGVSLGSETMSAGMGLGLGLDLGWTWGAAARAEDQPKRPSRQAAATAPAPALPARCQTEHRMLRQTARKWQMSLLASSRVALTDTLRHSPSFGADRRAGP